MADNLAGRETYPSSWKAAFQAFAALEEDFGATEAIRIFEMIVSRARKALVKPPKGRRGIANPEADVALHFEYERLRGQGKTADECIAILTTDEPDEYEAVQQRLKRLRRRIRRDN